MTKANENTAVAVQETETINTVLSAVNALTTGIEVPLAYNGFTDKFKNAFKTVKASAKLTEKFDLNNCGKCYIMKKELTQSITDGKARTKAFEALYADLGTDRTKFSRYCTVYEKILSVDVLKAVVTEYSISHLIVLSGLSTNGLLVLFGKDDRTYSKNYASELELSKASVRSLETFVKQLKGIETDSAYHTALTTILNYYLNKGAYDAIVEVSTNKKNTQKDDTQGTQGTQGTTTTTTNKTAIETLLALGDKAFENIDVKDIKALADIVTKALTAHTPTVTK